MKTLKTFLLMLLVGLISFGCAEKVKLVPLADVHKLPEINTKAVFWSYWIPINPDAIFLEPGGINYPVLFKDGHEQMCPLLYKDDQPFLLLNTETELDGGTQVVVSSRTHLNFYALDGAGEWSKEGYPFPRFDWGQVGTLASYNLETWKLEPNTPEMHLVGKTLQEAFRDVDEANIPTTASRIMDGIGYVSGADAAGIAGGPLGMVLASGLPRLAIALDVAAKGDDLYSPEYDTASLNRAALLPIARLTREQKEALKQYKEREINRRVAHSEVMADYFKVMRAWCEEHGKSSEKTRQACLKYTDSE